MDSSEFPKLPEEIQTLLHTLQGDDMIEGIRAEDWESVPTSSEEHLVAPLLYVKLRKSTGVPPSIIHLLEAYYRVNLKRNIQHLHHLGKWLKELQANHIPVVVLKGCHLAETVYDNLGARVFCDADLLVKPEDMDRAHRCLTKIGAFSPEKSFSVDLHWYLEDTLDIDMHRIWSRIQPATIGGINTHGLCIEDLLIHLCLHMGYHHNYEFGGLRTLCDIREIISRYGDTLDWGYIAYAASKGNFSKAICLPLCLTKLLLATKIPENTPASLCMDPIPTEPVKWALARMFTSQSFRNFPALSPNFWSLWASSSLWQKLVSFRKLLYPNKEYIAQKYPAPPRSLKRYFYYMVRLKRHLVKYLSVFARIVMNEPEMKRILEREQSNIRMRSWMTDEDKQTARGRKRGAESKNQLKQPFSH